MDEPRPLTVEDRVVAALQAHRFHVTEEAQLHEAIGRVLTMAGLAPEHEAKIGPRDRIDFLIDDVGLEVKLGGTNAHIAEQLTRYASSTKVRTLLLLTTRMRYQVFDGLTLHGKRVRVVRLVGGFL